MPKALPPAMPAHVDFERKLLFLMLLALSFWLGFFKLSSHDTFWHLKTGEYILANGVPRSDPFSFTAAGKHWVTHEWLAEVILYLLYRLGGIAALIAFKGIISAAIAGVIYVFGIRNGRSAALSAATGMLAVAAMSYMMYARPHAFTFLFLAVICMALFSPNHRARVSVPYRWILLPAIFLLWANMHAGFILGLAIYWIVAIREFLAADNAVGKRFGQIILPTIFATLICLANPSGYEIFYYPILISMTPTFKSTIAEWVSPVFLGSAEWLAKYLLALMSLLGLFASWKHIRQRLDISLIMVAVGVSAWMAMRNIQNFAVVLAFGLLAAPIIGRDWKFMRRIRWLPAVAALVWMLLLFGLIRDYQVRNGRAGLGLKKGLVAEGPATFLKRVGFEGNIVSALHDGGYLIWAGYPEWRVFIDGRLDVYGADFLEEYRRIIEGAPNALKALEAYGADAAVLGMPPKIGSVRNQLAVSPAWSLVYYDDYYLVYFKRNERNRILTEKYAFKIVSPLISGFGFSPGNDAEKFFEESLRGLEGNAESSLAHAVHAYALQIQGKYSDAASSYKQALEIQPGRTEMYRSVAGMYLQAAAYDSALAWYRTILEMNQRDSQVLYEIGILYTRMNDFEQAERYLRESLRQNPGSPARAVLERLNAMKAQPGRGSEQK